MNSEVSVMTYLKYVGLRNSLCCFHINEYEKCKLVDILSEITKVYAKKFYTNTFIARHLKKTPWSESASELY
jgi:hypothetical protein